MTLDQDSELSTDFSYLVKRIRLADHTNWNLNIIFKNYGSNKGLSHGAIFLATWNAILFLRDVKLANTCFLHS